MTATRTAPRPRRRSPVFSALSGGLTLLLAATLWLLFAPQSFGGQVDYATVRGNSMAPDLVDGDAVLIRRAPQYGVGDAVAARNPDLGVVLHRIIADDGVRFTLQGDNRPARDSYEPTRADILGKQWARVPRAGYVVRWLQRPIVAIVFGGIVLGLVGIGLARGGAGRRRSRRQPPAPRGRQRGSFGARFALQSASGQTMTGALLLIAIFAAGVAAVHYQATSYQTVTHTLAFTESGHFSYGDTVSGGVYDGDRLSAPEPVFLSLVDDLPVSFDYQLAPLTEGEGLQDVVGAHQLVAEVSHPNGWTATIPLENATLFAGQASRAGGILHIADVMDTIANAENRTGVTSLFYTLRIVATVSADGTYGGVAFSRTVDSAIQFRLSKEQLQFDVKESALESSANVTVGRRETIPRVLVVPLAGTEVPFRWFPRIALASLAVAAIGFAAVALATRALAGRDPAAQISARYGRMLVTVADGAARTRPDAAGSVEPAARTRRKQKRARPATQARAARRRPVRSAHDAPPSPVEVIAPPASAVPPRSLRAGTAAERVGLTIGVESFDDLARLADQRGLAVLWTESDDADEYVLFDGDVTYRFVIPGSARTARRPRRGGRSPERDADTPLRRAG